LPATKTTAAATAAATVGHHIDAGAHGIGLAIALGAWFVAVAQTKAGAQVQVIAVQ
jgi:hypothetical protein